MRSSRGSATMARRTKMPCKDAQVKHAEGEEVVSLAHGLQCKCQMGGGARQGRSLLPRMPKLPSHVPNSTSHVSSHASSVWRDGPSDVAGVAVNLSDRPSLCMSVMGELAAIGSSDHAIYTVHIPSATFRKSLYYNTTNISSRNGSRRTGGHSEWVTAVSHLPDGRLLSGGMDSKLCLWDLKSRCHELKGGFHTASISGVKAFASNTGLKAMAISSSYDKSLMLWDLGRDEGKHVATMRGHVEAVMTFAMSGLTCGSGGNARVVSGGRDGGVIMWDIGNATPSLLFHRKGAHCGHVTSTEVLVTNSSAQELYLTGGQDGVLHAWDCRANSPVHSVLLHSSTKGQGALSCISVSQDSLFGYPSIVTGGADKVMKVLDPRFSFQVVHTLTGHRDFIYSLFASGSFAWSGSGDGSLLVHDITNGKCLYGLGASAIGAAIRCINLAIIKDKEYLVCTGDDGNVMIYSSP